MKALSKLLKALTGLHLPLLLVILAFNLSCAASLSCDQSSLGIRPPDARNMPYKAFVRVISTSYYQKPCTIDEVLANPQACRIRTRSIAGSGFAMYRSKTSPDTVFVMTARHVCDHRAETHEGYEKLGHEFMLDDFYGNSHRAEFVISHEEADACVMKVNDPNGVFEIAAVAEEMPELGERVYNLAAPAGIFYGGAILTFEGFYSGIYSDHSAMFTIPAIGGSSGSPIFNYKGEVVSLIWSVRVRDVLISDTMVMRMQVMESLSNGIHVDDIKSLLKKLRDSDKPGGYDALTKTTSTSTTFTTR